MLLYWHKLLDVQKVMVALVMGGFRGKVSIIRILKIHFFLHLLGFISHKVLFIQLQKAARSHIFTVYKVNNFIEKKKKNDFPTVPKFFEILVWVTYLSLLETITEAGGWDYFISQMWYICPFLLWVWRKGEDTLPPKVHEKFPLERTSFHFRTVGKKEQTDNMNIQLTLHNTYISWVDV